MIKEELKQEAEELYKDWYAHKLGTISITDVICKMAEPREKRIAELQDENKHIYARMTRIDKVLDEKTEKITELEAQIEKMKWHDLRKDPDDLPTTPKDADEWRTVLGQDGNLWFYNENERSWYTIGDDNEWGTGTHVPIAWCEIPQFEEIKEK